MRTFCYRLRPSKAQHVALLSMLESQRLLYNAALEERISAWRKCAKSLSLNDQTKSLTIIRASDTDYSSVAYDVSKWTLKRLDEAFRSFFRRLGNGLKPGFPRFRSFERWRSFGYHQNDGLRIVGRRLRLKGLTGDLRMKMHRTIDDTAALRSAVFTVRDGIWKVALTMAVELPPRSTDQDIIGIDVGVNNLATDSDGYHYPNIQVISRKQKELRRAQRALARSVQGSKRRRSTRAKVSKIWRGIRDKRNTHLHDIANKIVRRSPMIVVEDLDVLNMSRSALGDKARAKARLNYLILDASFSRLVYMLCYKAESAGGMVIKVNARNTSRTCSGCGVVDAENAGRHRYRCDCGVDLHRDHNAAINIRERGIALAVATREAARGLGDANVGGCAMRRPRKAVGLPA
jgi:putative transposase